MDYIQIGKITAAHGLDGRISLSHNLGKNPALKQLKHIFIALKRESYIPFFIKNVAISNENEMLLFIEEIDTVEEAKKLSGKEVFLSTAQYEKLKPKNDQINFVGFDVTDTEFGPLGKIADLMETPGQLLASVLHKEKEVMIPLNEATIKEVNIAAKKLVVTLPEGLIAIYLE